MPGDEWTIPRVIARRRHADPHIQALVSDEGAITWADLDDASRAVASRLVRAGWGATASFADAERDAGDGARGDARRCRPGPAQHAAPAA